MQPGFFDLDQRHELLEQLGDPLPKIKAVVDWERFRPVLERIRPEKDPRKGGRPPLDAVLMFKTLVLQQLYNLSDDQTEFQIRDRYSFARFLDIEPEGQVPDAKTIWWYREQLKQLGVLEELFSGLLGQIEEAGYVARRGQIVDAAMVEAPRQRNRREDNERIKKGDVERQKGANHKRSKTRIRVEHVFAQQSWNGRTVRTIGFKRAAFKIGMMNLVYNVQRLAWLVQHVKPRYRLQPA